MSDISCLPVLAYDAGNNTRIEAATQRDGSTLWKVMHKNNVLAKDGLWELEPMPSNRDDEFLERCRFKTAQEALDCLQMEVKG